MLLHIVGPLAFRRLIPPLGNQFVYVVKMSSLASVIGLTELTRKAGERFKKVFECEFEAWAHRHSAEQAGHGDRSGLRFLFCGLIYAKREGLYFVVPVGTAVNAHEYVGTSLAPARPPCAPTCWARSWSPCWRATPTRATTPRD